MAIQHLTDQQIEEWTRHQKDTWWLENVYRRDTPQLTWRSGITGFFLGGLLSSTALYIGAKSGITIGVNLISVILAFAMFRILENCRITNNFSILENNCTQSIATSAGYMTTPMIACLTAYMVITSHIPAWWQMCVWMCIIAILGVLIAFPMKRRFINEDQYPFPEGNACGVVLDALYSNNATTGLFKAKLIGCVSLFTGLLQIIESDGWMKFIQFNILRLDKWAGLTEPWFLKERLDTYYYFAAAKFDLLIPKILGVDFRTLGLRLTLDAAMLGVGAMIGIRITTSCLIGAIINFVVLAPIMIHYGDIAARIGFDGKLVPLSRVEILNQWSIWWGVVIMVVGSLVSLLAKPEMFRNLFSSQKNRQHKQHNTSNASQTDVLKHIEVPLWISYVGIPPLCFLGAWTTHSFFGVPWLYTFISLPLVFLLTVICINSIAMTSWIPTSGLAKITQFTIGALDRSNPATNLIPAGMSAEVASSAAILLSDIKPGYMLGAKPRHQVIGHLIGIFSGTLACIPIYFLLFLPPDADGLRSTTTILSDQFSFPAAVQWKGVAELIGNGFHNLSSSAIISMAVAAIAACVIETLVIVTKGRFPLSSVSIGLGVVLPPEGVLTMWIGAMAFWCMQKKYKTRDKDSLGYRCWIENVQPIAAGLMAGSALIGIGNALLNVLM